MEMLLIVALTIAGLATIWLVSQLGFVWAIIALSICIGSLIVVFARRRAVLREEHLYDSTPKVAAIRRPLTPMDYSYRSNLDVPFFSFESQNYGKRTPRKRVRGIPIDRFLEFQEKVDALSASLTDLLERLNNAQAAESQIDQSNSEKVILVYPSNVLGDESHAPSNVSVDAKYSEPKKHAKLWRRKGMDYSETKTPLPPISHRILPEPDKPRRFRKARAGDPWDGASHWGWLN